MNPPKPSADEAPRRDLSEPACRRYQSFLERAFFESYFEVRPTEFPGEVKSPVTFVGRLTDARRGFILYHYPSNVIDGKWEMLHHITAKILSNGNVAISNKYVSFSSSPILESTMVPTDEELREWGEL